MLPKNIAKVAAECKKAGAEIIIVHGETLAEDVYPETNIFAAQCKDIDILAHPGLICEKAVKIAKKNNVLLEITSRKGHCISNGHVAQIAKKNNAQLIFSTDAHAPEDLVSLEYAQRVLAGAGLSNKELSNVLKNSESLLNKIGK